MTLEEFVAENGNKHIEIQDDGTIRILEEKGPWKPERGEHYCIVSDFGYVTGSCWDDDRIDNKRLDIDGTIRILEEKGPWKPERGEHYCIVSDFGYVTGSCWDDDRIDNKRLDIGGVFRTEAEANRALHRLKARKKFLDAGGHEGPEAHKAFRERTDGPMWCTYPCISGKLEAYEADYLSAFEIWFESEDDARKAIESLTDDEKAALCWMGENE